MYDRPASAIKEAEAFIITAGAGMGVDSGLPDFRGDRGFWKAYPAYERLGLSFAECATPQHFINDPHFAWGFYGHRTNLYRETVPHEGFHIIKRWIEKNRADYFVVTSNVDGQFQKAGYAEDRIHEVHGSIHWLLPGLLCRFSRYRKNSRRTDCRCCPSELSQRALLDGFCNIDFGIACTPSKFTYNTCEWFP
ncbi:NAD-dependent protein deacylase [Geobacter sp. OR-1]|nr:NAD-dependent protein deacylase [Geobacter sp. OR-1]